MYSDYQNVHVVFNSLIRRKPLSAIFRCNSSYCAPSPLPPGLPDGSNTLSSSPSLCVPRQYRVLLDHHGLYCPFQCLHGAGICRTGTAFTWCPACCYRWMHRPCVCGGEQWNQYLIPIPIPVCVCAAPVQGLAGPSRLILLSFPVPAWRRDLPDRHGFYLIPCVLLQVRWMHRPCVWGGEGRGSGLWQVTAEYGRKRLPAY